MIDKKKFWQFQKITIAIVGILLLLLGMRVVFARFFTDGSGPAVGDIAFYIIHPTTESQTLKMFDVKPDGKDYIFNIDVSNFKDDNVSEVDLEYTLELETTTNIPVDYKIYLNDATVNDFQNKEIIQDEDGMYFFKFSTPKQRFEKEKEMTNHYQLIVNFPTNYNEEVYQDLIDHVEVTITATQV